MKQEKLIVELNQQQLRIGENAFGQDVGKYKSDRYADLKKRIGSQAPNGVPDLLFSGKLYKEMFVKFEDKQYFTDSKVEYAKFQKERYGESIFDLQKQNEEEIEFKGVNELIELYKKAIGV
jgi:hypothetical protein